MLRPGDAPPGEAGGCRVLDYQTDARILHYTTSGDRLIALDLVDARHVLSLRDGGLSLTSDDLVADLHVGLHDGILELEASHPPPRL